MSTFPILQFMWQVTFLSYTRGAMNKPLCVRVKLKHFRFSDIYLHQNIMNAGDLISESHPQIRHFQSLLVALFCKLLIIICFQPCFVPWQGFSVKTIFTVKVLFGNREYSSILRTCHLLLFRFQTLFQKTEPLWGCWRSTSSLQRLCLYEGSATYDLIK